MFQSLGVGSGLDLNTLVSQLVSLEGQPKQASLTRQEISVTSKITSLGNVSNAVSAFKTAMDGLSNISDFQRRSAFSSDSNIFTLSASTSAALGKHSLVVDNLAESQVIASSAFADKTTAVGTGTLTFQFGTDAGPFIANAERGSKTVEITAEDNSVEGIRDAVNEANIGVSASIVNDGTGERLVFSSDYTGTENGLKVTVTGDSIGSDTDTTGLSQLAYDPDALVGAGKNISQTKAAEDAAIVMDGISITKASNTITDVVDGVTITLKREDPGVTNTLEIELDKASVKGKVESFVEAFNALDTTLNEVTSYDPESDTAAALVGDFTVRTVDTQIRSLMAQAVNGISGSVNSLSQLGIRTERDGTLSLDSSALDNAINNDFEAVGRVFAQGGEVSDALIDYVGSTSRSQAGTYNVNITQLASQGTLVGSSNANLNIVAGVNDTLRFDIDGVLGTVTLAAGSYTDADLLAAEVQSKVNGLSRFSDEGISVIVSNSGGTLTLTSDVYGSTSDVQISGGNGAVDLLGAAPVSTTGVDVEGTIGSQQAVGEGQRLTGNGSASGVAIDVLGGVLGDRGTIDFSTGLAGRLSLYLDTQVGTGGSIQSRIDNLNGQIDDIGEERQNLARRLQAIEARYVDQFSRLDGLISGLQSQGQFLTSALASLPGTSRSSGN